MGRTAINQMNYTLHRTEGGNNRRITMYSVRYPSIGGGRLSWKYVSDCQKPNWTFDILE